MLFGFRKQAAPKSAPVPAPVPAPVVNARRSTTPGKMFDMKNLGSIMRIKSTGCKSCGG